MLNILQITPFALELNYVPIRLCTLFLRLTMKVSRGTNPNNTLQPRLVWPSAVLLFPSLSFWAAWVSCLEQRPNTLNTTWSKEVTRGEHFILLCLQGKQTARAWGLTTPPSSQQDVFAGAERTVVLAQFPSCCILSFHTVLPDGVHRGAPMLFHLSALLSLTSN